MSKSFFPVFFSVCFVLNAILAGGNNAIDSLQQKLAAENDDSLRSELCIQLCSGYLNVDNDKALYYAEQALQISEKHDLNYQKGRAYYVMGKSYREKGKQDLALESFLDGIKVFEKLGDSEKIADGDLYIGSHYYSLKLNDRAIEYYNKALKIYIKINDKTGESFALNNLGNCYKAKKDYDNAEYHFTRSLEIDQQLGNKSDVAASWVNLGTIAVDQKKYDKAEQNFKKAIEVYISLGDTRSEIICLVNLGEVKNYTGRYSSAIDFFSQGIVKAKSINDEYLLKMCYYNFSFAYAKLSDFKSAYENLYEYVAINDSLSRKELISQLAEMAEKYEADKREKEILLLNEEKKVAEQKSRIQQLENEQQKTELRKSGYIILATLVGIVFLILLAALLVNRNRIKQRANELLTQQKEEILEKSLIIEEKNRDITDSIMYAKRIQDAILREENKALETLPEHFIFFKPKDIVSGDFYWTLKKNNHWYLAVVDCTGHGVPGAFMSMLGIAFLNEINSVPGNHSPAEILDELRGKIIRELGQAGEEGDSRDGMDMSLIKYHPDSLEVEFAGAHNPLWIIRNKNLIQFSGDNQPIGFQERYSPFTNHNFKLEKGDALYLLSDGYADQFGGPDIYGRSSSGKKFKSKRLKEMLLSASDYAMSIQGEVIERAFYDWKGSYEQIDDVTLIGIRI